MRHPRLCREHHLLKTFWAGRHGWRDEQLPDGTVVWTDPHDQYHVTRPGSYRLFAQLCEPTAPVTLSDAQRTAVAERNPACSLTMPRRRRTRRQDRAERINAERARNRNLIGNIENASAETYFPSPPRCTANDPPPF
jgi:hypothetical protein